MNTKTLLACKEIDMRRKNKEGKTIVSMCAEAGISYNTYIKNKKKARQQGLLNDY